jgi:hypothetical protein
VIFCADAPLAVSWSRIDGNANTQDSASTIVHVETVLSRRPGFFIAVPGAPGGADAIDKFLCPLPDRTPWFRFTRGMAR